MENLSKFTKDLFSRFASAPVSVGVEMGSSSLKLALVRQDAGGQPLLLDYLISPVKPSPEGNSPQPVSVIKEILKKNGISSAVEVKLAISGPDIDVKRMTLPSMPRDETEKALRLQAREHFLINIDEAIMDFKVLQETISDNESRMQEVVACVARSNFIDEKLSILKDSQLSPSVVLPVAYCIYNLYRRRPQPAQDECAALIDIGERTATIAVVKNEAVRFIRQIGCAGEDFTEAMSGALISDRGRVQLSAQDAEEIKKRIGIPDETTDAAEGEISSQQMASMVRPVIERLANEIRRSLDYYRLQFNEGNISRIYLSGGASKMKNIEPQLSKYLSLPVEPFAAPAEFKFRLPPEKSAGFKDDFPSLIPAIGAAVASHDGVNLIPVPYKVQKIKKIENISVRFVFILISLILLTFHLFNVAQEKVLKNLLAAKQPQWEKLREIDALRAKMEQKNMILEHTLANQIPVYYLFKALSTAKPDTPNSIYLEKVKIEDKASILHLNGIIIETTESAEDTLANIMKGLEGFDIFSSISLVSSQDIKTADKPALQFEITCRIRLQR